MGKTINTILNLQDKFSSKLSQASKKALIFKTQLNNCESAAKGVDKFLSGMAKTAVAASAAGVAAMTAFAASAVKTYGEFQQSMSNVAGILSIDQTSESYKQLESAAREAGKSTTKTAQESADALSYMALAGWNTKDSINGLMPILRASEATGADLATTSDLITDSMSALGLQTKDLEHYLDVCARAQNKSNTTLTQMQEAYIGVGGTFKMFNTPLQESGALLGILANRGIKGSEAGNALQSTLINLTKKSGESAKAMEAIGVSAYDSQGNFRGITTVLKDVQKATSKMTEEQRNTYLTMIGGKNQLTTLNALMSGLSATTSDGVNEFQALYDSLGDCEGSLNRMADTMTNNYKGAMARAGSAVDDLKITLGQSLEPYITQFLNWFAEKLPGATEKFALWLNTNIPKAISFCKKAFDKIKPVVGFMIDHFKDFAAVAIGTVVALKAFTIITKVVALFKALKTAETALKAAQILLNTSMLACPITWIAVGIGAVVAGLLLYKNACDKAKEADIASHFGDIALSAEECGRMVKNIFGSELVDKVDDLNYAWDRLDDTFKSLSESAQDLNKMTFMVEMNPTNVSQEDYLETAQKYIDNMQTALKDKQYELNLDIKFLFGDSETGNLLNTQTNAYLSQMMSDAQNLGNELVENIAKGYQNGWDEQSMDMVAKSLEKMSEIQQKIQKAQAEAQMELLTTDFKMSDLSQESFEAYIEKLNEQGEAINQASKTAASNAMAAQKLMLDDGAITQQQYNENIKKITEAYEKQSAESLNTVLSEGMNAIHEVYGSEFDKVAKQLNEDLAGEFVIDPENLKDSMLVLQKSHEASMSNAGIGSGVKENINSYLEKLKPSADELKKMATKDQSLWKVYGDTLTSVEALKTLTGSGDQMGNAVISGVNSSENIANAETAGRAIKEALLKPFGEPANAALNINIKYGTAVPTYGPTQYTEGSTSIFAKKSAEEVEKRKIKANQETSRSYARGTGYGQLGAAMSRVGGHATGTTYFGGGLTYINEHGGEIIDLPQGSRIYPSDKSAKMMESKPSVTVNVKVEGNIYGSEQAADEIGSAVCERILNMIYAI